MILFSKSLVALAALGLVLAMGVIGISIVAGVALIWFVLPRSNRRKRLTTRGGMHTWTPEVKKELLSLAGLFQVISDEWNVQIDCSCDDPSVYATFLLKK